jgi:hypothetical protein
LKTLIGSGILALMVLSALAAAPALAASYSIELRTDQPSYTGTQPITILGTISPAPGPNTAVVITISNSAGTLADIDEVYPDQSNGSFSFTSIPGGNPAWTTGVFTANATWGGPDATASQLVTFRYTASSSSTTSTSSTSSTHSVSSSSSSISTSSASSSTTSTTAEQSASSSTTSKSVPEFPAAALSALLLACIAAAALAFRRYAPSAGHRETKTD